MIVTTCLRAGAGVLLLAGVTQAELYEGSLPYGIKFHLEPLSGGGGSTAMPEIQNDFGTIDFIVDINVAQSVEVISARSTVTTARTLHVFNENISLDINLIQFDFLVPGFYDLNPYDGGADLHFETPLIDYSSLQAEGTWTSFDFQNDFGGALAAVFSGSHLQLGFADYPNTVNARVSSSINKFWRGEIPVEPLYGITRIDIEPGIVGLPTGVGSFTLTPVASSTPSCDFNGDGNYDVDDLDMMFAAGPLADALPTNMSTEQFDLNENGVLDVVDRDVWLAQAATENGLAGPYLLGDANLSGGVEVSDFNAWNSNKFTFDSVWSTGDFNGDGPVDVSDFNLWLSNRFTSSDVSQVVPEPSGYMLILLFVLRGFKPTVA